MNPSTTLILLVPTATWGLITGSHGNQPVENRGWASGTEHAANHPSRLGWWEGPPFGGGEYHFLYRGDTAAFQEALQAFAKIRAPRLELVIKDGPNNSFWLDLH